MTTEVQTTNPDILDISEKMMSETSDLAEAQQSGNVVSEMIGDIRTGTPPMQMNSAPRRKVKVWRLDTGEELEILSDLLATTLNSRDGNGNPIFVREPQQPRIHGSHLCKLHRDHPMRPQWDRMGLPPCSKATLDNEFQVDLHVKTAHKPAAEAIEQFERQQDEARREDERREDRQLQREMLRQQTAIVERLAGQTVPGHVHKYGKDGRCVMDEACTATDPKMTKAKPKAKSGKEQGSDDTEGTA